MGRRHAEVGLDHKGMRCTPGDGVTEAQWTVLGAHQHGLGAPRPLPRPLQGPSTQPVLTFLTPDFWLP